MHEMRLFYSPAFVAAITGPTKVRIWLEHPDRLHYDFTKTYEIDLTKTPSNRSIRWDDIDLDDHVNSEYHGYTSLGPVLPHVYCAAGVYLSEAYCKKHEISISSQEGALSGRSYERIALVRDIRGTLEHFHGFHIDKDLAPGSTKVKLLVVSHADTSLDKRAPLVLWVPADKLLPHEGGSHTKDLTESSVFIDREFAQQSGLDVPKRPSGSGEARVQLQETTRDAPVPGGPLNVFGDRFSDEILRINEKLRHNAAYLHGGNLEGLLDELKGTEQQYTSLDLIGHSRSNDGVLKIGELPIIPAVVDRLLTAGVMSHLRRLQIRQIRLLGCRTSCSAAARGAIQRMAELLKKANLAIEVLGTRADIFAAHYDRGYGFAEHELLVPQRISLKDGPGDGAPIDDEPVIRPSETYNSGVPRLDRVEDVPQANLSTVRPKDNFYVAWHLKDLPFDLFKQVVATNDGAPSALAEESDREVVLVDQENQHLRSMAVLQGDSDKPRVRITYDNVCFSYPLLFSSKKGPSDRTLARLVSLLIGH